MARSSAGASWVPGTGSEPGSTASSSRSRTATSTVSGAITTPTPSACTSATRLPGSSCGHAAHQRLGEPEARRRSRRRPPSRPRCRARRRCRRRAARRSRSTRPSAAGRGRCRCRESRARRAPATTSAVRGCSCGRSRGSTARDTQARSARGGDEARDRRQRCKRRGEGEPEQARFGEVHGSTVMRSPPAANGASRSARAPQANGWFWPETFAVVAFRLPGSSRDKRS